VITSLSGYRARNGVEAADLARIVAMADAADDPWARSTPLHLTASALIVHPASHQVLLRWHDRQGAWLQVGGHADPGERDPFEIARREGEEETGLTDLVAWPEPETGRAPELVHVVVVPVPAKGDEPAHEHADLRYVLSTEHPERARAEHPDAPVRWFSLSGAAEATTEPNLRETLERVAQLFEHSPK
jgi:8-oxo-dGTP pyrophosphatase MutT (NUDIX family)